MRILRYLAGAVIPALAFTSCLSDNDNYKNEATYNYGGDGCFNYVTDLTTEESVITDGPRYTMVFDYTGENVQVDVAGLKLTNDLGSLSFKLPKIPFVIDNKSIMFVARQSNVVPTNATQSWVFDKFEMLSNPGRYVVIDGSARNFPIYLFEFTINNRYKVTTFPVQSVYMGSTATYHDEEGEPNKLYRTKNNMYCVILDYKKLTATLQIVASDFAESMPSQSFYVKNLPVKIMDGSYMITTDPEVSYPLYTPSDKVMEGCSMSNVKMSSTLSTGTTAINFHLDLSGLKSGAYNYTEYDVTSSLTYYSLPDNTEGGK